ncbi:hypothetical protein D9M68_962500 [compost metagenome]
MAVIVDEIGRQRLDQENPDHDGAEPQQLAQRIGLTAQIGQPADNVIGEQGQRDGRRRHEHRTHKYGRKQRQVGTVVRDETARPQTPEGVRCGIACRSGKEET